MRWRLSSRKRVTFASCLRRISSISFSVSRERIGSASLCTTLWIDSISRNTSIGGKTRSKTLSLRWCTIEAVRRLRSQ